MRNKNISRNNVPFSDRRAANWGRSLPAAVRRVFPLPNIDAAPVSLLLISHQARIEFACRTFHFGIFLSDRKCRFTVYDVWCGELCECVIFWEWDRDKYRKWRLWREKMAWRIILLAWWLFLNAINAKIFSNWSMTGWGITDEAFFSLFVRASRFQCVIRSSTNGQTCKLIKN